MPEINEIETVIKNGSLEQITALFDKFPDLLNQAFDVPEPISVLLIAIASGDVKKIELLLARGADIHQKSVNVAEWYLEQLSRYQQIDIAMLHLFINSGVKFTDDFRLPNKVLDNVYSDNRIKAFNALLDLGFDPVAEEKRVKDAGISRRSCGYAIEKSLSSIGWEDNTRIASKLLKLGATTESSHSYSTIMGQALQIKAYAFMQELLAAEVEPVFKFDLWEELIDTHKDMPVKLMDTLAELTNIDFKKVDREGDTLLHRATYYHNANILDYFIAQGAVLNAQNNAGQTALHACVQVNFKAGIKALIALGADLNITDKKGNTALDLALKATGFKQMRGQMVKAGAKTSLELVDEDLDTNDVAHIKRLIERCVESGEVWAETFLKNLHALSTEKMTLWHDLIRHAFDNNSSKPSKKWMKETDRLIDAIGVDDFREMMALLLPLAKKNRSKTIKYNYEEYDPENERGAGRVDYISEGNTRVLKGLLWACSRFNDSVFSSMLRKLAAEMYKKIYGIGMRNAKLGNASLYSLSQMEGTAGLKEIVILRASTKYNPALVNINRVFDKLAKDLDMTPDELAAISIPDYGLTAIGYHEQTIGDFNAQLSLVATGKTDLVWHKGEKTQKTLPAALKRDHAGAVKALKGMAKELQVASRAHTLRIEQQYLKQTLIDFASWKENYVDHKLIGFLARRLIWRVSTNKQHSDVIYSQAADDYVDANNKVVKLPAEASVILWHPSMATANEVLAWRNWLIENEVTQPFKQAHREVYFLTDAERATGDHSLRFANHILNHNQFNALAIQRGWAQTKGGSWDGGSENAAYKSAQGFSITFEAEGLDQYDYTNSGMYACVGTSTVTFSKGYRAINLDKIDPLLFSEVMRDVDLFVGVSSVGNDPNWSERNTNRYWQDTSFGELSATAKTRFDVLSVLIPKLKIAPQLTLEGRFLKVVGKLCTYKIHLGSSNILMEPNDSYLCIVGTREKKLVMLPFEGDRTLSMILSKAMLLANDNKIKDETILSQINGVEAM